MLYLLCSETEDLRLSFRKIENNFKEEILGLVVLKAEIKESSLHNFLAGAMLGQSNNK